MKAAEATESGSAPPSDGTPSTWGAVWSSPPGWLFHWALLVPTVGLLWSHSVPGLALFLWLASSTALGLGALVWAARSAGCIKAGRRGSQDGNVRWFLLAPIAAAIVLGLILVDAPLRARWAVSRPAFEKVVHATMRDDAFAFVDAKRLGLYEVVDVRPQRGAVIFYEKTGALSDDAGFAYLPNGPFAELESGEFENPQFRHLGGPWYAWTASW